MTAGNCQKAFCVAYESELLRAIDGMNLNVRNKSAAKECYIRTEFCLEALMDAIREDVSVLTLLARSGKSTYLQQVCLVVILAQIGCYVPARFATLRVVDRIFTRMGTMDSVESNSSTFMTEMKETAFILQNASHRATSSSDGFAIAWSCCEHLLALRAYTIFASHMENLSELATIYPNVKIVHFDVEIKNKRMDFKFQLKDGPRHVAHYGLMLAGVAGLPSSVIESAQSITSKITQKEVKRIELNFQQHHDIQMAYRVAQRLVCLKYSNQDEDSIRQALQNLKESYINGGL
ncbi:UNVERIFIED_CONTAM: DNA mismatch repair protein MSH4 [Sesamum radiatum]|uniref:DNA mismatch repair protein MSH4 n=1 Tax=Sesamum radiatum TaxID=300843 RepID=A0AAW2L0S5_SESRA